MGSGSFVTVLVADDNNVALRLCQRVLEKKGYKVLTASDGQAAVSMARANSPGMILLDDAMPGMTSLDAMRQIKRYRPFIPIVITSMDPSPSNSKRFLAAGADEVMIKPFRLIDLVAIVTKLAARRTVTPAEEQTRATERGKASCSSCGRSKDKVHLLRSRSGALICVECARTWQPSDPTLVERALAEDRQPSLLRRALAENRQPPVLENHQPSGAPGIRRPGSAHEEHVHHGRRWCAVCGWLDEITVHAAFAKLYHSDITEQT